MGDFVIAAYKPKPGREADLLALTKEHVPYLRTLGLVTQHPATTLRAAEGTILEIFEWQDGALDRAHAMPVVL